MEILQLKYFCDAARNENFSKTAQKFMIPPSCVSASVKRLENELGVNLFERSANKISLNETGRKFLDSVSLALNILEKAEKEARETEPLREIRLLVSCSRRIVTECIEKFRQKQKDVSFSLTHKTEQSYSDFDMIVTDAPIKEASEQIELFSESFLLAVEKNHPLAKKELILPSDLKKQKFITMQRGSSHHRITEMLCREHGFSPDIAIEIDDPYYMRKYIEMGLGVGFVPTVSWEGMFHENVVLKKVRNMDYQRKTYLVFPKFISKKHHDSFSDTLINFCKKYQNAAL